MKKILILLFLVSSFTFANVVIIDNNYHNPPTLCPDTFEDDENGNLTYFGDKTYVSYQSSPASTDGKTRFKNVNASPRTVWCYESVYQWHGLSGQNEGFYKYNVITPAPTCSQNQHLENNICVCNSGYNDVNGTCVDKCPGVNNFLLSNDTCSNCNYDDYLQDAQCNCQAINSQLDPKPYLGLSVTDNGISYTQYTATCQNGISFYIFVKDVAIPDNNISTPDNNSSSNNVDYNSTSDNDYNSTGSLIDNNSTSIQNTNHLGQKLDNIGSLTASLGSKIDNLGKISSSSNSKLSSIDNSLKAISSKNDFINSNLQAIKNTNKNGFNDLGKKIDDVKKEVSGDNFTGDLGFGGITDFYNNLQTDLDSISSQYDYYKGIYSNGFTENDFSIPTGVHPAFTAIVFNHPVTIDLCPAFSTFKPILYLIFSFLFLFIAVKITWLGIKFQLGGN